MPTISIRDLEIQRRENDLVLASFGRGFFVLDDYSPLRQMKASDLDKEAIIYPVKDALMYIPDIRLGVRGKGFLGESLYNAPNPPVGATFTYYLKDDIKTIKEKRREKEQELIKKGQAPYYPSIDSLRLEDEQPEPHLLFTITDESGNVVRRLKAPAKKGLQRMVWDFRYSSTSPIDFTPFDESFAFSSPDMGQMALPGTYKVSMSKFEDGKYSQLTEPVSFRTVALGAASLPAEDQKAVASFSSKLAGFKRVVDGTDEYRRELVNRVKYLKAAVIQTPGASLDISTQLSALEKRLNAVNVPLNGDATRARREFETTPSVNGRLGSIMYQLWNSTSGIPGDYMESYAIAEKQFSPIYSEIKSIGEELKKIEAVMEKSGAPYTPGRLPDWK
jgi:hypothetical protein